jgi:hypothetical protein
LAFLTPSSTRVSNIYSGLLIGGQVNGIATDPAGNIYSGEWLIGGRYTKLAKLG